MTEQDATAQDVTEQNGTEPAVTEQDEDRTAAGQGDINGAQALIRTLVDSGVEVCFSNPGTSEMHFVAALDQVPRMRGVLTLFEGVATGAADGYARIAGRPAAVLLHLGPGLGNGLANLHNARRAGVPVVNVVGDHALDHQALDAPLQSDIVAVASNVSSWIREARATAEVGRDAAETVAAAIGPPGEVATLVLPADVSWGPGGVVHEPIRPTGPATVPDDVVIGIGEVLRAAGEDDDRTAMLFLGGAAVATEEAQVAAARVAAATGCQLMAETFPTRMRRGEGLPPIPRLGYLSEAAVAQLAPVTDLVLVDAAKPVTFFAYPDKPSQVLPDEATVHRLADSTQDAVAALQALADHLDAPTDVHRQPRNVEEEIAPELNAHTAAQVVARLIPHDAIVVDEAVTSSVSLPFTTIGSRPHDWLCLTGGSIGFGLPAAVGAAIAAPDRRVLALQADGSAMYTPQALWSMAREDLDVTVVLYNNASYEILKLELQRVGADGGGERSNALLDLGGPTIDFVALARSMGVPATRATTTGELEHQLRTALATDGPSLVEAVIPKMF